MMSRREIWESAEHFTEFLNGAFDVSLAQALGAGVGSQCSGLHSRAKLVEFLDATKLFSRRRQVTLLTEGRPEGLVSAGVVRIELDRVCQFSNSRFKITFLAKY
jgi:hypothetical protein